MFLFHVADWYKLEGGGDDAKLGALIVELEHDVPAFAKIRELANAAKHWKLRPLKRRGLEPTSAGDMTIITTRAPPLSVSQPGRLVPDRKWWERGLGPPRRRATHQQSRGAIRHDRDHCVRHVARATRHRVGRPADEGTGQRHRLGARQRWADHLTTDARQRRRDEARLTARPCEYGDRVAGVELLRSQQAGVFPFGQVSLQVVVVR